MKFIYCFLVMLCPFVNASGQTSKGLNIGDPVPDISFGNIKNSTALSSSISAYRGKVLILDFMQTSCSGCIEALPHFDSLQSEYGNKLQIILVSPEPPDRVEAFLRKHPGMRIPFVAADSTLASLFPHQTISHIAWIGPDGFVKGITYKEYINTSNITALLQGQSVHWPVKREATMFDGNEQLWQINENNIPDFSLPSKQFYTSIIGYMPGIRKYNITTIDTVKQVTHRKLINYSIIELYLILKQLFELPMSRIVLENVNRGPFVFDPATGYFETWQRNNYYSIETVIPANVPITMVNEKLISDLDFHFGLKTSLEKRWIDCMVLRNTIKKNKATKNAIEGIRVGQIVYLLNNTIGAIPVLNESSGTTYMTLAIKSEEVADNLHFNKVLNSYGLELVKEKREVEVFIIKKQ